MSFIKTFTGIQLHLLQPEPEQICLEDIAHGLAMKCRFNGQTKDFYSVAEHSVRVAYFMLRRHEDPNMALAGLFHDAAEAYLPDIATPVKNLLTGFQEVEGRLLELICKKFDLPWPLPKAYKEADRILMVTEGRDLMGWNLKETWALAFPKPLLKTIHASCWQEAKLCFLETYYNLIQLKSDWQEKKGQHAMESNPFNLLGLAPTATPDEVADAYKKKMMEVQPSKGGTPKQWKSLLQARNQALCSLQAR